MDAVQAIMTRRSVRSFKSDPLSEQQVWRYLEAANMAPTASNRQPWRFMVIQREELDKIQGMLAAAFQEKMTEYSVDEYSALIKDLPTRPGEDDKFKILQGFYKDFGKAPLAILVYMEKCDNPWDEFLDLQSASAAIQNLILAAWSDGVGSCWVCGPFRYKAESIKQFFGIADKKFIALLALGYPEVALPPPPKENVKKKTIWFDGN